MNPDERITEMAGNKIIRLPLLGKIRLGIKAQTTGGVEYPKETDYFVCPPEVESVYGKEPKELEIMFPVNDIAQVFDYALRWYGSSKGLKCEGDGGGMARRYNEELKKWEIYKPCPCEKLKTEENPKGECSMRAYLRCMLYRVSLGGVFQIATGSKVSRDNILSGIDFTEQVTRTMGIEPRFAMIPMKLRREPMKIGDGEKQRTHYILHLNPDMNIDSMNRLAEGRRGIPMRKVLMPAVDDYNPEFDEVEAVVVDEDDPKIDGRGASDGVFVQTEKEAKDCGAEYEKQLKEEDEHFNPEYIKQIDNLPHLNNWLNKNSDRISKLPKKERMDFVRAVSDARDRLKEKSKKDVEELADDELPDNTSEETLTEEQKTAIMDLGYNRGYEVAETIQLIVEKFEVDSVSSIPISKFEAVKNFVQMLDFKIRK